MLIAYSNTARVRLSCRLADIDPRLHYYWLRTDPAYVEAFAEAKVLAKDMVQDMIVERAQVSDTMLIFLGKGLLPELYRDAPQTNVNIDRPVEVTIRREG